MMMEIKHQHPLIMYKLSSIRVMWDNQDPPNMGIIKHTRICITTATGDRPTTVIENKLNSYTLRCTVLENSF